MGKLERIREAVKGPLDTDYIRKRELEGWRLIGVEWEVEWEPESGSAASSAPLSGSNLEDAPFGTQIAADCERLEENSNEMEFLLSMMELIIQDISISKVAEELIVKDSARARGVNGAPSRSSTCFRGSSSSL